MESFDIVTKPKKIPLTVVIKDPAPTVPTVPKRWVYLLLGSFGTILISIGGMVLFNPFPGPFYVLFVASFLVFLVLEIAAMTWTIREIRAMSAWKARLRRVRDATEVAETGDPSLWEHSIDGPS